MPEVTPDPKEKAKVLYDAISKEYEVGSYDDFFNKLQDSTKRKTLYDAIGNDYDLGTFDDFSNKVVSKKKVTPLQPSPSSAIPSLSQTIEKGYDLKSQFQPQGENVNVQRNVFADYENVLGKRASLYKAESNAAQNLQMGGIGSMPSMVSSTYENLENQLKTIPGEREKYDAEAKKLGDILIPSIKTGIKNLEGKFTTKNGELDYSAIGKASSMLSQQLGAGDFVKEQIRQQIINQEEYSKVKPAVNLFANQVWKKMTGKTVDEFVGEKNQAVKDFILQKQVLEQNFQKTQVTLNKEYTAKSEQINEKYKAILSQAKSEEEQSQIASSYITEMNGLASQYNSRINRVKKEVDDELKSKISKAELSDETKKQLDVVYNQAYKYVTKANLDKKQAEQEQLYGKNWYNQLLPYNPYTDWEKAKKTFFAPKFMALGWKSATGAMFNGISNLGNGLVGLGLGGGFTDFLRGQQQTADKLETVDVELKGMNWLKPNTFATRLGKQIGFQAPIIAATAFTKNPFMAGTIGFGVEQVQNAGEVYNTMMQQYDDPIKAQNAAKNYLTKNLPTLPLYFLESEMMLRFAKAKPGVLKNLAAENLNEVTQELIQRYTQQQEYKNAKSLGTFLKEDAPNIALETALTTTLQSGLFAAGGKIMKKLGTDVEYAQKSHLYNLVSTKGLNAAFGVLELKANNNLISPEEMAAQKEKLTKLNNDIFTLKDNGLTDVQVGVYLGLTAKLDAIREKQAKATNPQITQSYQKEIESIEKKIQDAVMGKLEGVSVTLPSGSTMTLEGNGEDILSELKDEIATGQADITSTDDKVNQKVEQLKQKSPPPVPDEALEQVQNEVGEIEDNFQQKGYSIDFVNDSVVISDLDGNIIGIEDIPADLQEQAVRYEDLAIPKAEEEKVPTEVKAEVKEQQNKIKSSQESNIEALINPKTGLAAVTKKILDEQQPLKDAFLKRKGLTIEDYRKLNDAEKDKIQSEWVKSKEFEELNNKEPKAKQKEEKTFVGNGLERAEAKRLHQMVKEMPAPTDANEIALRYIADGGTIGEEAINEVAGRVKRARLNTGEREFKTNEAKARDYYRKEGETLDELAHRLWEKSGQEVSEIDIKDALMTAIRDNNTRLEASKAYLEKYNPEYAQDKHYERIAEEKEAEYKAEQERIAKLFEEEAENEILGLASQEHINNLINQYEAEFNRENQEPKPTSQAEVNKPIGSRTSGEENEVKQSAGEKEIKLISKPSFDALIERISKAFPKVNFFYDEGTFNEKMKKYGNGNLMRTPNGTIYGATFPDGSVYINQKVLSAETPIHEASHIWEALFPKEWKNGIELFRQSKGFAKALQEVQSNKAYKNKTLQEQESEALNTLIGRKGEGYFQNELLSKFKAWLQKFFNYIGEKFGVKLSPDTKLNQFVNEVIGDILGGKPLTQEVVPAKGMMKINGENVNVKQVDVDVVNGFYSPLEKIIKESKFDKLPAKQWAEKFAKGEEAKWTGLADWLSQQQGSVSKADIQQYLKDNRIQVVEVVKGGDIKGKLKKIADKHNLRLDFGEEGELDIVDNEDGEVYRRKDVKTLRDVAQLVELNLMSKEKALAIKEIFDLNEPYAYESVANEVKFGNYQLEGEKENYKEVLVTLPEINVPEKVKKARIIAEEMNKGIRDINDSEVTKSLQILAEYNTKSGKIFYANHFEEPNILVHLRMNTRKDSQGNKVLFLEEIQSDWGQKGKQIGFDDKAEAKRIDDEITKLGIEKAKFVLGSEHNKLHNEVIQPLAKKLYGKDYYNLDHNEKMEVDFQVFSKDKPLHEKLKKAEDEFKNKISEFDKKQNELEQERDDLGKKLKPPKAPFVTDTNAWTKLGLKVALKEAVKQGVDKIAWTTGEQQNERYDLSKQVDRITVSRPNESDFGRGYYHRINIVENNGKQSRIAVDKNGIIIEGEASLYKQPLDAVIGKEMAEKIMNVNQGNSKEFSGLDLKIGGKGMKGFYGSLAEGSLGIVGNVAKSLFRQEPKTVDIDITQPNTNRAGVPQPWLGTGEKVTSIQYSIDITPELRAQVEKGQPMFMAKGSKIFEDYDKYNALKTSEKVKNPEIVEQLKSKYGQELNKVKDITLNFDKYTTQLLNSGYIKDKIC